MPDNFIPFHRPSIGTEEIEEVTATLRSGWLTTGPRTAQFEREFREYVGAACAQAVNSCTAGLHLSLVALGIGPGDEVITSPMTFCSTVTSIMHTGATPVLADIGADGNIDPESIEEQISERTRAIVPVHFGGLPCDMDRIWALAQRFGLFVIEDAAHAAGAMYRGRKIGESGDPASNAVAFSFYATKNLTTGEGGMVTVPSAALAEELRVLCLHGINRDAWDRYTEKGTWKYQVARCGFKYNLSDLQSAIGIHQARKLENFIATRERYAGMYRQLLSDVDEVETAPEKANCRHAWHLYVVRLNLPKLTLDRSAVIEALRGRGIGTSVHFIPVQLHPFFSRHTSSTRNHCPRSVELYERSISLPLYPALSEDDVCRVAAAVKAVIQACRRRNTFAFTA